MPPAHVRTQPQQAANTRTLPRGRLLVLESQRNVLHAAEAELCSACEFQARRRLYTPHTLASGAWTKRAGALRSRDLRRKRALRVTCRRAGLCTPHAHATGPKRAAASHAGPGAKSCALRSRDLMRIALRARDCRFKFQASRRRCTPRASSSLSATSYTLRSRPFRA
ncbi:hypothetical protein C8J57DRAFT_1499535 [Mycena rebaudengoi]|nr:hypothetical protein C8J57DRAFT_1499535 [Mycena rebaudengoi]